ncbi:MAG: GTPase [Deltaproteobacteria bacterium]|nr:GTPase [Deltaproteobacteria bacterium]
MVYFSPATKEITAKIVYYGPGMCGKTTNLQKVHELMRPQMKTDLVSVATETDRTIYFDFLPVKLGKVAGFDFVVRSFTVPGQPYYAETRKMVLQGADGVVFVADSQRYMLDQNKDSLMDLKRNLKLNGLDYYTIPLIIQYNKRDLPDILDVADLDSALNDRKVPTFTSSAYRGQGVVETLKAITLTVFKHVRDGGLAGISGVKPPAAAPGARASAVPAAVPSVVPGPASPTPAQGLPRPPPTGASASARTPLAQLVPSSPPAALQNQVQQLVANAEEGQAPMPSREAIGLQEFQNLAVLHHRLTERVAQLEKELQRVGQEHQDLKRIVGRKLMGS